MGNGIVRNAVIFACDKGFLPYTITAIERIRELEPDASFDICVCSDSLDSNDYPFENLGINFVKVDLSDFGTIDPNGHLPPATYARLVAPNLLRQKYDRIIYCDGDTYLLNAGLERLFDINMKGYAIAAVPDRMMWYSHAANRFKQYLANLDLTGIPYLNAGVLLIDVKKYAEERIFERAANFTNLHRDKLDNSDQSALNGVLRGDWLQLSVRWNWQNQAMSDGLVEQYQPFILHFNGRKPWMPSENSWHQKFYKTYYNLLAKNFALIAAEHSEAPPDKYNAIKRIEDYIRLKEIRRKIAKLEEKATD